MQLTVERGSGRSPREVKERLRILSDRFSGGQAINMRHQPIPWAYRVFYRHIGLDPDVQRTPVEELALERMKKGGFKSQNLLDDALTIAIIESGVAVRAFDADRVSGGLGIRPSVAERGARGAAGRAAAGHAGRRRPGAPGVAAVRGDWPRGAGSGRRPSGRSWSRSRWAEYPAIAVEEALWLAAGVLRGVESRTGHEPS